MSRGLTSTEQAQATAESLTAVTLVKLEFGSGTLYANNSAVNISYDGQTWLGAGKLGAIAEVSESTDLAASNITLTLVGTDTTLMSAALNEDYRNRDATMYLAFLNNNNGVIGTPSIIYRGKMDGMAAKIGEEVTISLTVVNRLADWERTRNGRYTNEEQQNKYSGDKGLEFTVQAVEKQIYWGRNEP